LNRIFSGLIVVVSVLASNQVVRSQSYHNFAQFYINPSLINPAYTGIDGQPAAFLSYKRQWMGIKGTPSIGNFSIQTPTQSKVGVGLSLGNDTQGLLSSTSLMVSGSYYVPFSTDQYLRFGLSIGAAWTKVDMEALSFGTTSDAIMGDLLSSNIQLLGNAGVSFHSKTFQIGASLPNIFQPAYLAKDAFTVSEVKPFESIIFQTSYRLYFGRDMHAFEPHLIYRLNGSLPSQFEVAGIVHLKSLVWFGGSYKQNFGISALAGIKFNKLMGLGYSYTLKNTGDNELAKPSHEIHLAMLFGTHQKKTPVYSFINSEKEKGRKNTTHEKQQYYAKNNPKNNTKAKQTPLQPAGRPRNSNSDPTIDTPTNTNQVNTKPPRNNPTTTSPTTTNPTTTRPTTTNPVVTNPTTTNPSTTTPTTTSPATTNPTTTRPATTNPVVTNPTTTNPSTTTPTTTSPTTTNPTTTRPTTTNPVVTNPSTTNPSTTTPTTTSPTTTNPSTTTPTTTSPTTTNPTTTRPTTTNPVVTNPTTTNPSTTTPTTTSPTTTNPTTTNPTTTTNPVTTTPTTTEPVLTRPEKFASATDSIQHTEEEEKINRLAEHSENPTEEHNEEGHPHAERHEFAQRGNHAKELELGDFVIVGAFRSEPNAKHMTDELRKLGFSEVDYGYLTSKSVWYIHFAPTDDIEEAKTKRNKYRKMKMFKDAWLLTVHQ
jgi:type IX secretion system PorP/SprF family membrane protein